MKIEVGKHGVKTLDVGLGVYRKVVRTKKDTNEKYEDEEIVGYYGTLSSAIVGLLKYEVNSSEATNLKQLVTDYEQTKKKIFKEFSKCK